jgi:hypothetical protein
MPRYQPNLDQIGVASSWGSAGLSGRIVLGGCAWVPTEVGLDGSSARLVLGGLVNLFTLVLIHRSFNPSQYPVHGWLPIHCSMMP